MKVSFMEALLKSKKINKKSIIMFVQIFRSNDMYLMVNVNHIVSIEPAIGGGNGCTIILSTGTSFYSIENYNAILNNISRLK